MKESLSKYSLICEDIKRDVSVYLTLFIEALVLKQRKLLIQPKEREFLDESRNRSARFHACQTSSIGRYML